MTAQATEAPARPRVDRSLVAALIGNFLVRLDGGIVGQMITLYIADIERRGLLTAGPIVLGLLALAFYAVELAFSPIMGAKCDQYGNRLLLLIGPLFGLAAVTVASAGVIGTELLGWGQLFLFGVSLLVLALALTRILQGFAAATSIPSILSYLSVRTEGSLVLRGRIMAIFEVTTAIGLLGGYVAGPQLWKIAGPWGFILTGLIFLASAAFFLIVREDRAAGAQHHGHGHGSAADPFLTRLRRIMRRRDLLVFVPAWLSVNAIVGLWGLHLVYQMRKENPDDGQYLTAVFSPDVISAVLGGAGLIFCVGIIVWGSFVLGRLREVTVMRLSAIGLFGLCAAAFAINHAGAAPELLALSVLAAAVALGVMSGFLPAAVTYLARLSGRASADRGLLMGLYSVVLGLGQAAGTGIGGLFAAVSGVDGIILFSLLLGLVAAFSVFRLVHVSDDDAGAPARQEIGLSLHA